MGTLLRNSRKMLYLFVITLFVMGCTVSAEAASTRKNITLNGSFVTHTFTSDEDVKWWDFTVPAVGKLTITTQASREDTYFYLYNEDQTIRYFRQQFNEGSVEEPNTQIEEIWLKAGTYHYMATDNLANGYGGDGDVRTKITFEAAGETEIENNDTFVKAMPLSIRTQVKGVLSRDDRYDFYALQVTQKGTVDFTVTSYTETFAVTVYNSALEQVTLYDEDKNTSKDIHAEGSVEAPRVYKRSFTADTPGTYYIKFSDAYYGEDHTYGTYLLSWQKYCTAHVYDAGVVTKAPTTDAEGVKTYTCTNCGATKTVTIEKVPVNNTPGTNTPSAGNAATQTPQAGNPSGASQKEKQLLVLTTTKKTVKYNKLKKAAQSFKLKAVSSKGKLTFKKVSGSKRIVISKTGTVKVGKKLKKGTYKVKVKITAAASGIYKKTSVTKTIKVVVK